MPCRGQQTTPLTDLLLDLDSGSYRIEAYLDNILYHYSDSTPLRRCDSEEM